MLLFSDEIIRGKDFEGRNKKYDVVVKPAGIYIRFASEVSKDTWKVRYFVVLVRKNFLPFQKELVTLIYDTKQKIIFSPTTEAILDGVTGADACRLKITKINSGWFRAEILSEDGRKLMDFEFRWQELINLIDETAQFLLYPY